MAIQQEQPRRAVLTAIGGAFAALVANAFGRPLPVRAEGETMHVGGDYLNATTATQLKNTTTDNDVMIIQTTGGGRALYAKAHTGHAIEGRTDWQESVAINGVVAAFESSAVIGLNEHDDTRGVLGGPNAGVLGNGVRGVWGITGDGSGVLGTILGWAAASLARSTRSTGRRYF